VDVSRTIITHDAGSPRDQISPFWEPVTPLSYIGWGKTTQLGTGLGYAMGAKLAAPDKLCVNVWGDAAIGFTGMDFETAVRERIPILSVLLNNFSMAIELKVMMVATEKYRSTDISGHYADMARAFGGHVERVTEPGETIPAIKRAVRKTEESVPALLELISDTAVGIGGRQEREFRSAGVPLKDRGRRTDEALRIMRRCWAEDEVTHDCGFWKLERVTVLPKPVQQPMPLWIGAISEAAMRRAGRLGDGWIPSFITPAEFRIGVEKTCAYAGEARREIPGDHFGALVNFWLDPDPARAR